MPASLRLMTESPNFRLIAEKVDSTLLLLWYLFIDGAHLKVVYRDNFEKVFAHPYEVDFEKVKRHFGARKAFYYDCLDKVQREGEKDDAFKSRIIAQEDYFDRIRAVPGMHVREGHLSQGRKKQQK